MKTTTLRTIVIAVIEALAPLFRSAAVQRDLDRIAWHAEQIRRIKAGEMSALEARAETLGFRTHGYRGGRR